MSQGPATRTGVRGHRLAYEEIKRFSLGERAGQASLIVSYDDTMPLRGKHERTLRSIFEDPTRAGVLWTEIESLLTALGAELSEGRGSRVRVYLNGARAVFHRPHPKKETDKGALRSVRRFLTEAGVQPGQE